MKDSKQNEDEFTTENDLPKKKRRYAYMPVQQIVNILLAIGVDASYFRIGEPSDFYSDVTSKSYSCTFMRDLHEQAIELKQNNPDLPDETHIVLLRIWTDGFENKKISPQPEYNNVNAFTLTLLPHV